MISQGFSSRLGFDPARLRFAFRTSLTACAALFVAWALGLDHPQWSAMTVWVASQPTLGSLIEKSAFRIAGTIVGASAGVGIVMLSGGDPRFIVPVLALWVGLCAGAGNILRGFASYGAILAGYSAAMVSLLDTGHPDHIVLLGIDRMLTILVGVVAALVVGLIFTRKAVDPLAGRARRLTAQVLADIAGSLSGNRENIETEQRRILTEMAAIDEQLDPHGAGSLRSRRSARTIRALLIAQVAALLWLKRQAHPATAPAHPAIAAALREAALAVEDGEDPKTLLGALDEAQRLAASDEALHGAIAGLALAVRERRAFDDAATREPGPRHLVILHRDIVGARHAAIRAVATLLAVGAMWILSGWSGGAFVMLGTAVMVSLFSTFDAPSRVMRTVVFGQILGASGVLACRWLVWPLADSEIGLIIGMMPFVLIGALLFAHRRTAPASPDYNLVFLLLSEPVFPLTGTFGHSLAICLGVLTAPLIAMAAFRLIFPTDARRRMARLIAVMLHELEGMAADPRAITRRESWRARLYHRLLALVRWADRSGGVRERVEETGMTILLLGESIMRLHQLADDPTLPRSVRRCIAPCLGRLRRVGTEPERARRALERLFLAMQKARRPDATFYSTTAQALTENIISLQKLDARSMTAAQQS